MQRISITVDESLAQAFDELIEQCDADKILRRLLLRRDRR